MKKLGLLAASLISLNCALAEDLNAMFQKVTQLVSEKRYSKALAELNWMKKEIETMNNGHLKTLLPESVLDYKGGTAESNSAMGFMTLKRSYKSGDNQIEVELTGGSSAGAGNIFGGLAAFGNMAAMMGVQGEGQNSFRIEGRTAMADNSGAPKVSVFLESGSVLAVSGTDAAIVKKFAEAMGPQIVKIDEYMKG